jgi:DNA-directed RNA polymerase specialized sigma24 family protein
MDVVDTGALSEEDYEELLANQDWASLSKRLTEFAFRKLGKASRADAEDVAQIAMRRAFDPRYQRWNPRKQPDIFWFLGSLVRNELANRRRARRGRVEIPHDHEELDALASEAVGATDDAMISRERARRVLAELERRTSTDGACAAVLATFRDEIDDPNEQAARTGRTLKAVYNARSRLRALATEIARDVDQETLQ